MVLQGQYFQREEYHRNDGSFPGVSQTPRLQTNLPSHQRPQTIQEALNNCCGIPVKDFVLLCHEENGDDKIFTSQSLHRFRDSILTERCKSDFRRGVRAAHGVQGGFQPGSCGQSSMYGDFEQSGSDSRRPSVASSGYHRNQYGNAISESSGEDSRSSRKRPRYHRRYRHESIEETPVPVKKTQSLRIDDEEEVEKFYVVRFKGMQQYACKIMGKAFVKFMEPKKQTHHPYTGGAANAPDWWPRTDGEGAVRHREPDHLYKPERIKLLVHILKLIVEPNSKQNPSIQKLDLNVKKLEEVAWDVMTPWFNDKDNPKNLEKKPYLKEVFKVAKAQERYKNGEIDGTTMIPVMYGDNMPGHVESDDEDESCLTPAEEDEPMPMPMPSVTNGSMPTPPESIVSPTLTQGPHHLHHPQHELEIREAQSMLRHNTQPSPQQMHNHHVQQFNDSQGHFFPGRVEVNFQPQTSSPSNTRRSFISPTTYSSPQPSLTWQPQQQALSAPTNSSGGYYTHLQSNLPPIINSPYLPPPNNTTQGMQPPQQHQYDSLKGGGGAGFDHNPHQQHQHLTHHGLRTASLPTYLPEHGYHGYLSDGGASGNAAYEAEMKCEQQQQQQGHMSQN